MWKIVIEFVKKRGVQGEWISSGQEAVSQISGKEFQIVFTDIMMPDWDGFKTAQEIHAMNEKIVIVACTAEEIAKEKLDAVGISFLLQKPITKKRIFTLLSRIAKRKLAFF